MAAENNTEAKPAENKETKTAAKKTKVWHITQRKEDKLWQVKAEGNEKATRTFTTKKEAEEYVKTLVAEKKSVS